MGHSSKIIEDDLAPDFNLDLYNCVILIFDLDQFLVIFPNPDSDPRKLPPAEFPAGFICCQNQDITSEGMCIINSTLRGGQTDFRNSFSNELLNPSRRAEP